MIVYVTEDHIRAGVPKSNRCCPVAQAVCQALVREGKIEPNQYVWVGKEIAIINNTNPLYMDRSCLAPEAVRVFELDFDNGTPVNAFSFEVEL